MGEASFCTLTGPTKRCDAHHCYAEVLSFHSFPARLKYPSISNPSSASRLLFTCHALKDNNNLKSVPTAGLGKRKKKKVEDDPWEALFQQLEKDLENDTDDPNDEEITEEDVANFEKELDSLFQDLETASTDNNKATQLDVVLKAQADKDNVTDNGDHGLVDDRKGIDAKQGNKDNHEEGHAQTVGDSDDDDDAEANYEQADYDDEDLSDDDLEEPRTVALQKWQLRKLAAAAELGRRKVNIKSLAAELKLDRHDVIYFLKSPPPELLMALSELEGNRDEDDESDSDQDEVDADSEKLNDSLAADIFSVDSNSEMIEAKDEKQQTYGPRDWYKGKRIKKANILTLQRVYRRSRWPSNAMIESLVQATHLPRVRVLEWFEEERAKSGVQSPPRQSTTSRKSWKRPVTHSFERLQ